LLQNFRIDKPFLLKMQVKVVTCLIIPSHTLLSDVVQTVLHRAIYICDEERDVTMTFNSNGLLVFSSRMLHCIVIPLAPLTYINSILSAVVTSPISLSAVTMCLQEASGVLCSDKSTTSTL